METGILTGTLYNFYSFSVTKFTYHIHFILFRLPHCTPLFSMFLTSVQRKTPSPVLTDVYLDGIPGHQGHSQRPFHWNFATNNARYVHQHATFQIQDTPQKKMSLKKTCRWNHLYQGKKRYPFTNGKFCFQQQTRDPTLHGFYHTPSPKARGIQTPHPVRHTGVKYYGNLIVQKNQKVTDQVWLSEGVNSDFFKVRSPCKRRHDPPGEKDVEQGRHCFVLLFNQVSIVLFNPKPCTRLCLKSFSKGDRGEW
jgi:hypothetical protein